MNITLPARTAVVAEQTQVLVVGGGPAGIGAAIAAARQGADTILLEKRGFLGGNITACYVETCNHFLNHSPFTVSGIYREMEAKYRQIYGSSHDLKKNAAHRFSSEYLKIFLDEFVAAAGVRIQLHSFVNEVVAENGNIRYVVVQSKQGPQAIRAEVIIDCTGDGDVAFSAGVPFEQGRETDGLCQPGTLNFRVAGVDVEALSSEPDDWFKSMEEQFRKDYLAGTSGLSCKRKDIPTGRLTPAGQLTYINYPCAYRIDPTSTVDLTRGEIECRRYIREICRYLRTRFAPMRHIEVSSIAPEIGFRDSRRIKGDYRLTMEDIESSRTFTDAIAYYPRFYDMLSPDGKMGGDGCLKGRGNHGHIYVPVEGGRTYQIPYRSLLPVTVDNLLVAGRCLSSDHIAESSLRAISCCTLTGQAAGTAAALAIRNQTTTRGIDVRELRGSLKRQGVDLGSDRPQEKPV